MLEILQNFLVHTKPANGGKRNVGFDARRATANLSAESTSQAHGWSVCYLTQAGAIPPSPCPSTPHYYYAFEAVAPRLFAVLSIVPDPGTSCDVPSLLGYADNLCENTSLGCTQASPPSTQTGFQRVAGAELGADRGNSSADTDLIGHKTIRDPIARSPFEQIIKAVEFSLVQGQVHTRFGQTEIVDPVQQRHGNRPCCCANSRIGNVKINSTILGSLFMPLFFGTTIAAAALAVLAAMRWNEPDTAFMLTGGAIHIVGMFLVTVIFNVPLNNELARADPAYADTAAVWTRYLRDWTFWNHVRTIASTAASALFIAALLA
jgi:uncharacterized membrane protein